MSDGVDIRHLPLGQHRVPCPQCDRGAKDRAVSVKVDADGATFLCHRCGFTGAENGRRDSYTPPQRSAPKTEPLEWSATAERIWRTTQSLRGTLGSTYLQHRGCALPPRDSHLRYLPPTDQYPPSLCAAITDAVSGDPLSLHFTRLAADGSRKAGTDCDRLLLKGHRKAGGVIRLWPDDAVTTGLAIAEGIETSLAAAHAHTPTWAAIDAGNLAAFPVLDAIEALTIFADYDPVGLRAAETCGERWDAAGREVYIVQPTEAGSDAADLVAA